MADSAISEAGRWFGKYCCPWTAALSSEAPLERCGRISKYHKESLSLLVSVLAINFLLCLLLPNSYVERFISFRKMCH